MLFGIEVTECMADSFCNNVPVLMTTNQFVSASVSWFVPITANVFTSTNLIDDIVEMLYTAKSYVVVLGVSLPLTNSTQLTFVSPLFADEYTKVFEMNVLTPKPSALPVNVVVGVAFVPDISK